jgi:hypothetical protein
MEVIIDLRDVSKEFALDREQAAGMVDYVVKELTAKVAENWAKIAQQRLKASRERYMKSIYVGDTGRFTGFVQLRGVFPNMVEAGASPFDQKPGFLNSPKAKPKKNGGMYFTVPFSWGTPGAEVDIFSNILPPSVYKIIKSKESQVSGLGGVALTGQALKTKELPFEFQIPSSRKAIVTESKTFAEYKHKTAMLAGVTRSEKIYESATQGKYKSFRRVSDTSDPLSWIHPGIEAQNLAEKAMDSTNIKFEVDRKTDEYLGQIGF